VGNRSFCSKGEMAMSDNPQLDIMCHYAGGGALTVVTARELYHTTELRRVNSRLNPEFKKIGKEIKGKFLNGDKFKTYRLVEYKLKLDMGLE
jgi:hypothetical protein